MSVKIRGHKVRWHKPIKVYTFFKSVALLAVFVALAVTPSVAAEKSAPSKNIQLASSGDAVKRTAPMKRVERAIPADSTHLRIQRSAGTPSAPAMALALALGYRNISGPMERTAPPRADMEE